MRLTLLALSIAFALPAFAGGPVVIREEPEVIAPTEPNVLPLLLGILVVGLLLSGGSDDERAEKPKPCGKIDGGC